MPIPVPRGQTLRQIAQERGWNIDWNRLNQSGNDDGNAYRREIFDMINQAYNPYGTLGATGLDPMGRAGEVDVSIIPDDLRGTQWEAIARRLGAPDAPSLRGMLARGRGNELYMGDRGMYNEYAADLGNMVYDPDLGWIPGEGGFQEGERVGQSFRNMQTWGPAAVLGVGALYNTFGAGAGGLEGLFGEGASSTAGGSFGEPMQFLQPNTPGGFNTMLPDPFGGGSAFAGGGTAAAAGGGAGAAGASAGTAGAVIPGTTTPTVAGLGNNAIANVAAGTGGTTAAAATGGPLSFLGDWASGITGTDLIRGGGLLYNLFGSGPGTSRGATNAGNAAAAAADPFASMRPEFQEELRRRFQSLISFDPSQIENDPAYQFQLRSGTEARNRAAAASGMYRSGNREMELTRFGQDLASNFTQQQFQRNQAILQQLAGLAGANSGSPGGAAQALLSGFQGASTLQNNAMNNIFSWLTGGGQSGPAPIDRIWNWLTS